MNYDKKVERAIKHAEKVKLNREIKELYHSEDEKRNKIPTHKIVAAYVYVVLTVILIYSMVAMWKFGDLSYLGVLVGDIGGMLVNYAIYSHHSTNQTREGGIQYLALQEELKNKNKIKDEVETDDDAVG